MAAGDIVSVTVLSDGWEADVKLSGLGTGGTYAFGMGTNNNPSTGTPKITFTVVSLGYDSTGAATTVTRSVYGTQYVRMPYSSVSIAGSFGAGTFQVGETITQGTSGATAVILFAQSSGPLLYARTVSGSPDSSHVWTGGTSGATFTASGTPSTLASPTAAERYDGTNTTVRIALSEYIFQKDATGGGNSGTAPVVNILSGFYTKTAVPNNASGAAFAVTNSSTAAFPVCLFQWDHIAGVCTADRVKGDFSVAGNARHRFGIACVKYTGLGQTSTASASATVVSETATIRSATSNYQSAHIGTIPITGFTQGELIDLRAQVYPAIGDSGAVIDTNSYTTATDECLGRNKPTILCDKSNLLDTIIYCSPTGNDTTGNGSSGNPYLTISKGSQNGNIVYLKAGAYTGMGATASRKTTSEWVVVQPAPGESSSTVTLNITTTNTNYRCQRLRFDNVAVQYAAAGDKYLDGDNLNFIRFTNCPFNSNGQAGQTVSPAYNSICGYFENCTGDLGKATWKVGSFSSTRLAHQFDGVVFAASGAMDAIYRVVACKSVTSDMQIGETSTSNPAPTPDNFFFEGNTFYKIGTSGGRSVGYALARNVTIGASFSNNVLENISGGAPMYEIAGSGSSNTTNIIFFNNSTAGERWNIGYEVGANTTHTLWCLKNNAAGTYSGAGVETITDLGEGGGASGANVGNWSLRWGVGWSGNIFPTQTGAGTPSEFLGLKNIYPAQPDFVNDASFNTGGSGLGNYHLISTSIGLALQYSIALPYDVTGLARSSTTEEPGAYRQAPASGGAATWRQGGSNVLAGNLIGQSGIYGVLV